MLTTNHFTHPHKQLRDPERLSYYIIHTRLKRFPHLFITGIGRNSNYRYPSSVKPSLFQVSDLANASDDVCLGQEIQSIESVVGGIDSAALIAKLFGDKALVQGIVLYDQNVQASYWRRLAGELEVFVVECFRATYTRSVTFDARRLWRDHRSRSWFLDRLSTLDVEGECCSESFNPIRSHCIGHTRYLGLQRAVILFCSRRQRAALSSWSRWHKDDLVGGIFWLSYRCT
ncbi:hypothetical protein KCU59_g35, partial [Aureobasidium melanogenum]